MTKQHIASLTTCIALAAMLTPTAGADEGSDPVSDLLDWCVGLATIDHHVKIDLPSGGDSGQANDNDQGDFGTFLLLTGPDPAGLYNYAMAGLTVKGICDVNLTGHDPCPRGFPAEEWQDKLGMPPPCVSPTRPPLPGIPV